MAKSKIYNGDKLTEDAKHFCKILQINPNYLKPRTLESFKEDKVSNVSKNIYSIVVLMLMINLDKSRSPKN